MVQISLRLAVSRSGDDSDRRRNRVVRAFMLPRMSRAIGLPQPSSNTP